MKIKTKDLVTAAVLLAIAIVLPSIFHLTGINGSIFSPMHIPVLLSGFILGPYLGAIIGILSPILNSMITGMPAIPFLWVMVVELFLYGLISGLLYKKSKMNIMASLIISMIIGRVGGALSILLLTNIFGFKLPAPTMFLKGATITAIPGIIIQLIIIPTIVTIYEKNSRA